MTDPQQPPAGSPPGWVPPPGEAGPPAYPPAGVPYGQPGAPYGSPPKAKRFGWVALVLAFVGGAIASLAVVAVLIGIFVATDKGPSSGSHGTVREGAAVPSAGDCLGPAPAQATVTDDSDVVDCDEAHGTEVSAVVQVPAGDRRPATSDLNYLADDVCLVAFEGYVGKSYDSSDLDYRSVLPSREAWAKGDRTLVCLVDSDGLSGTVRNSHR